MLRAGLCSRRGYTRDFGRALPATIRFIVRESRRDHMTFGENLSFPLFFCSHVPRREKKASSRELGFVGAQKGGQIVGFRGRNMKKTTVVGCFTFFRKRMRRALRDQKRFNRVQCAHVIFKLSQGH